MQPEEFIEYCLSKEGAAETYPFGPDTLVVKVCGKMFALFSLDAEALSANLKCDPEWAQQLREEWQDIQPGYHMNKTHWNTIHLEGGLPVKLVKSLIDHSYQLVVSALPVKDRQSLSNSNHHGQG